MNAIPKIAVSVSLAASLAAAGSAPIVTSINGVSGSVTLAAGTNVTIVPSGKTLTISSPAPAVAHDTTLSGSGTAASPLGIASGQAVRSINGSTDSVTIAAGAGVKIQTTGNTVTVSAVRRRFYETPDGHDGAHAAGACAIGFHMASLWEILNPSGLRYDLDLGGSTADDQGGGPPADNADAWVRTGFFSLGDPSSIPGAANCNAWTSANAAAIGTSVRLANDWFVPQVGTSLYNPISPWEARTFTCDLPLRVWCVEDDAP